MKAQTDPQGGMAILALGRDLTLLPIRVGGGLILSRNTGFRRYITHEGERDRPDQDRTDSLYNPKGD